MLSTTALLHTLNSVGSAVRLKQHPVRLPLASGIIGGCIGAALCRRWAPHTPRWTPQELFYLWAASYNRHEFCFSCTYCLEQRTPPLGEHKTSYNTWTPICFPNRMNRDRSVNIIQRIIPLCTYRQERSNCNISIECPKIVTIFLRANRVTFADLENSSSPVCALR